MQTIRTTHPDAMPPFALCAPPRYLGVWQPSLAQQPSGIAPSGARRLSQEAEERGLAEPFKGVTTDGNVVPGLFPIRSTGVSTAPVRKAAEAFLAALTPEQRAKTMFPVDDPEWRKWMNQHFYVRQGVSFKEMTEAQREAAFGLLRASLSAKGLQLTRDIMRLNHTLGELNNNNFDEYGEWLYWITVMGAPSDTGAVGLAARRAPPDHQLLRAGRPGGDDAEFVGSEPVTRHLRQVQRHDRAAGRAEQGPGDDQRARRRAAAEGDPPGFQDRATTTWPKRSRTTSSSTMPASAPRSCTAAQREQLLDLIGEYVGNMDDGHAQVKMDEVRRHLDDTYFAWIGGTEPDSVFYYRIHSPVILIEFDHQTPDRACGICERGKPTREHIHTVVRTPNGNDYGKDLLRQHYQQHPHPHKH